MRLIAIFLAFGLAGCGAMTAKSDMVASKDAYKACLDSAAQASDCDRQKAAYEADLAAYKATNDALTGGNTIKVED